MTPPPHCDNDAVRDHPLTKPSATVRNTPLAFVTVMFPVPPEVVPSPVTLNVMDVEVTVTGSILVAFALITTVVPESKPVPVITHVPD